MTHPCIEANYLLTSPKVNLFVIKNVFIDFLRLLIHVNIKLVSCTYCYFANLQPLQEKWFHIYSFGSYLQYD